MNFSRRKREILSEKNSKMTDDKRLKRKKDEKHPRRRLLLPQRHNRNLHNSPADPTPAYLSSSNSSPDRPVGDCNGVKVKPSDSSCPYFSPRRRPRLCVQKLASRETCVAAHGVGILQLNCIFGELTEFLYFLPPLTLSSRRKVESRSGSGKGTLHRGL